MTEFDRLHVQQGLLFKDAVLTLAETKSLEIIAEAGKKRANELEEAYKLADGSDYASVKQRYIKENEKEFMAVATGAKRELLEKRGELVRELFDEVEQKLRDFVKSSAYFAFLSSLLQTGAADIGHEEAPTSRIGEFLTGLLSRVAGTEDTQKSTLAVRLRPEDAPYKEGLQALLPSARFLEDKSIRLGGLKVDDGHVLFDETLDRRLADAKNRFYESGRMSVS